jgi:hypothetical protein
MSGERESEDDVDIYGDLQNLPCLEDTVKEVSITEFKYCILRYRASANLILSV